MRWWQSAQNVHSVFVPNMLRGGFDFVGAQVRVCVREGHARMVSYTDLNCCLPFVVMQVCICQMDGPTNAVREEDIGEPTFRDIYWSGKMKE